MCYFSDAETAKKMRGKFSSDDLEAIAKSLFPRALRLQIGCGAEPTVSQNLLQLVQLGKQYGVKHITITTNGNLLTYEKLHKLVEILRRFDGSGFFIYSGKGLIQGWKDDISASLATTSLNGTLVEWTLHLSDTQEI